MVYSNVMDIMVYSTNNSISFTLFMFGFLLVLLGIFWLFSGLGSKDPDLILRGIIALFAGLAFGGVTNIISAYKYY